MGRSHESNDSPIVVCWPEEWYGCGRCWKGWSHLKHLRVEFGNLMIIYSIASLCLKANCSCYTLVADVYLGLFDGCFFWTWQVSVWGRCLIYRTHLEGKWLYSCLFVGWNGQAANKEVVGKMFLFLSLGTLTYPPCPPRYTTFNCPLPKTMCLLGIQATSLMRIDKNVEWIHILISTWVNMYQRSVCVCVFWKIWS